MMRLLGPAVAVLLVTASVYGSDDDASTSPSADTAATTTAATTSLDEAEPSATAAAGDGSSWSGPSVNRQPADDDVAAHWQEMFETAMQQDPSAPGLWVAIADPDLGYWQAAIGNAIVDGAPATIEDHHRIGSVTKTFTAVAVLQLVADDKLTLDATVESVIPETAATFPPTAQITVEQLLNMTSGLPDYANTPGSAGEQSHRTRRRCGRRTI